MKKENKPQKIDYYFIPKDNSYGIREYICILKWKGILFEKGPRSKENWCYDLSIISSEFDSKIKTHTTL